MATAVTDVMKLITDHVSEEAAIVWERQAVMLVDCREHSPHRGSEIMRVMEYTFYKDSQVYIFPVLHQYGRFLAVWCYDEWIARRKPEEWGLADLRTLLERKLVAREQGAR